jgi:hypothetical protein
MSGYIRNRQTPLKATQYSVVLVCEKAILTHDLIFGGVSGPIFVQLPIDSLD